MSVRYAALSACRKVHTWRWPISENICSEPTGDRFIYNRMHTQSIERYHFSMTLSDLWPGFQGHNIFWSGMSAKRHVLKTKLLLHNRKLYLTYGMVLCLVTLTDLYTRRAGLWASAELLVSSVIESWQNGICSFRAMNQCMSPLHWVLNW